MSGCNNFCPVWNECGYPYKGMCDCVQQRKFRPIELPTPGEPVSLQPQGTGDLGRVWNHLAAAMHLLDAVSYGMSPRLHDEKKVRAREQVELAHAITQKIIATPPQVAAPGVDLEAMENTAAITGYLPGQEAIRLIDEVRRLRTPAPQERPIEKAAREYVRLTRAIEAPAHTVTDEIWSAAWDNLRAAVDGSQPQEGPKKGEGRVGREG